MTDVITVDKLAKSFGPVAAVRGVSFSVRQGEVFGILGPNGAGKTTTMECIEGLQKPTSGHTLILGIDTHREPEKVKERIGVQLQASAYFDHLTLREILELFGSFYSRSLLSDELLSKVSLQEKANTTVARLSGGQKQRFTIAATLVNDPEVVFLDEPTTGLDPQARRSLWEFIQSIHEEGRTVVLTTHYMEEAEFLCQRVAIMDQGQVVALDTPTNLVRSLPVPYQVKVIAQSDALGRGLEALDSVKAVRRAEDGTFYLSSSDATHTLPALMEWAHQTGTRLEYLEVLPANLEDVFLSLTGRELRD
ncbi:MAG: ABC transporter ATP-binding protein [Chloroflexi bacterium]|nr:ABC transporter ATP-binding protein [Chloroflexota bacterium]